MFLFVLVGLKWDPCSIRAIKYGIIAVVAIAIEQGIGMHIG
jgi:hypothetical protein